MKIYRHIHEMQSASRFIRNNNQRLGFVPTMGALHEGHLSLVRAAKEQCDVVAVSIFVNPTQFGPNEDFTKYPRTFEHDCELLEKEGVDLIFAPASEEMYPQESVAWVTVESLSDKLCGRSRPGHFRGVTTIVSKLFHIVEPDAAFFGQKDAAQLAIIRRMTKDLNFPVEIVGCPIVREADGLAMSSRNTYLSPDERKRALALYSCLLEIKKQFGNGEAGCAKLIAVGKEVLLQEPSIRLDYLEIVDADTLNSLQSITGNALAAVAAFVGTTRLIDNAFLVSA